MKQAEDNRTLDMLPPPKRGRGRPAGATPAKTSADRMRALRERQRENGLGEMTVTLPLDLIAALDQFIQFKDLNKDAVIEKLIRGQLLRKR